MSIISASTTLTTALQYTADTTGTLVFKTGATPTTALTLNADQSATFAGTVNFATAGFTNLSYTGTFTGGTGVIAIGTNQIYKDASGNVGIGTASPATKLDVVGLIQSSGYRVLPSSGTSAAATFYAGTTTTNVSFLQLGAESTYTYVSSRKDGTGTYLPFQIYTSDAVRVTVNASGNVGIGTTAPTTKLTVGSIAAGTLEATYKGNIRIEGTETTLASQGGLEFKMTTDGYGAKIQTLSSEGTNLVFATRNASATWSERMRIDSSGRIVSSLSGVTTIAYTFGGQETTTGLGLPANGVLSFYAGSATERMRIDSTGVLFIGTTSQIGPAKLVVAQSTTGQAAFACNHTLGAAQSLIAFANAANNAIIGTITNNGNTAVAYNTTSDYRLKENVAPIVGALATVSKLKPCTYAWKEGGEFDNGFIAHELQAVLPNAVTGEKDAVNEDGSIKPQGVDYSKVVATLTAAIQELKAEFDEYKATHP